MSLCHIQQVTANDTTALIKPWFLVQLAYYNTSITFRPCQHRGWCRWCSDTFKHLGFTWHCGPWRGVLLFIWTLISFHAHRGGWENERQELIPTFQVKFRTFRPQTRQRKASNYWCLSKGTSLCVDMRFRSRSETCCCDGHTNWMWCRAVLKQACLFCWRTLLR